ncbi:MAG: 7-carboxy-7-deazaguanine synthase QueE [Ostreibacterium sp.]
MKRLAPLPNTVHEVNMGGIYISEIFGPTIQGEGQLIGSPTVFVRVGGCDYRCLWCDSQYAVKPQYRGTWERMSSAEIFLRVKELSNHQPILVTLSGGNPAMYDFSELISLGHDDGFTFAMETQGSMTKDYFSDLDYLTISPKPPSSKTLFDPIKLAEVLKSHPTPTLKIVIADEKDYKFAKRIQAKYPDISMILQPCNPYHNVDEVADISVLNDKLKWLIKRTQQDAWYEVRLLPQLHVLLWNNKRGV